jgi:ribosome assembly protein YihI (activator of Der GTPase)
LKNRARARARVRLRARVRGLRLRARNRSRSRTRARTRVRGLQQAINYRHPRLSVAVHVPVNVLVRVHEKEDDKIMKARKLISSSFSGKL